MSEYAFLTLRSNRISREFNTAAITARSAKKSVSYHDLYNLSTADLLFDEKKRKEDLQINLWDFSRQSDDMMSEF